MDKITICICTFKRRDLLRKCLQSLYEMDIPTNTHITLTVIDNHDQQSAKTVVDELTPAATIPTHYVNEPKRGIPHARNRAMIESRAQHAKYLVFIDDDEWVAQDWLCKLYQYCLSKGGELVVSGKVIAVLPDNIPNEIAALLMDTKNRLTGARLTTCATNNVIFPLAITEKLSIEFDTSNPRAGGEDTVFFTKMAIQGVVIERCAEAIVYEHIPPARATLKWQIKRKFWTGTINAWRKHQHGRYWSSIFISSTLQVLFYGLLAAITSIAGPSLQRNKAILKMSRAAGEISGIFGYRVDNY